MSPYLEIFRVLMGPRPVRWHALRASQESQPAPQRTRRQMELVQAAWAKHKKGERNGAAGLKS